MITGGESAFEERLLHQVMGAFLVAEQYLLVAPQLRNSRPQ
jgi:hypothetical protein